MQSSLHYSGINISYMHFVSDLFHTLHRDFGLLLCTAKQHSIPLSGMKQNRVGVPQEIGTSLALNRRATKPKCKLLPMVLT
jgi:hypothetical protein